jgi:hypothetical protein
VLTALQQLLASIVDYAGLFPPAQLSLSDAIATYDRARASPHAWMLDRFVIPAARLPELSQLLSTASESRAASLPWTLSVILSKNWETELEQIRQTVSPQFSQVHIRALEVAPLPVGEMLQVCQHLPAEVEIFWEIPFDADLEPYLQVLRQTHTAAKLRTGGISAEAFPDSAQLSQRILSLAEAQIPFKATAGLHHALRGNYHLTPQPNSVATTMPGFLNLATLAALAQQQRIRSSEALNLLEERSITAFQFTDTAITWRDHALSLPEIERSRRQFFRSFGSCSLQEPLDDLDHLGLL